MQRFSNFIFSEFTNNFEDSRCYITLIIFKVVETSFAIIDVVCCLARAKLLNCRTKHQNIYELDIDSMKHHKMGSLFHFNIGDNLQYFSSPLQNLRFNFCD